MLPVLEAILTGFGKRPARRHDAAHRSSSAA
jgi:hypothetical protein